jgi:hypothetical protein
LNDTPRFVNTFCGHDFDTHFVMNESGIQRWVIVTHCGCLEGNLLVSNNINLYNTCNSTKHFTLGEMTMQQVPFTDFAPAIQVLNPKCQPHDVVPILQKWMRFRLFWPRQSLNPEVLGQNLKFYYLPCWLVATLGVSGKWIAKFVYTVEVDGGHRACSTCSGKGWRYLGGGTATCDSCGGSGQVAVTMKVERDTFFSDKISTPLKNQLLAHAKDVRPLFELKLEDDWRKNMLADVTQLDILAPDTSQTVQEAAQSFAKDLLRNMVTEKYAADKFKAQNEVSDVKKVTEISILEVNAELSYVTALAYPAFFGTYTHEGKEYAIQIDAYTSKARVEMPDSIMSKYKWVNRGLYVVLAALVASFLFSCGTLYNVAMRQRSDAESLPWLLVVVGIVIVGFVVLYWIKTFDERVA